MKRVQLTLDERSLAYLRSLVETGECASLSHAVRKIIAKHIREKETAELPTMEVRG
jgi:Arc/MetJ-type ribon-helix-helix transcriptional regulator